MELVHCIYCSVATNINLSPAELDNILEASRRNNSKVGVTGLLLYEDGSFFQLLEGDRQTVDTLYDKITLDKRHHRTTKIVTEAIKERAFGACTMGYPKISSKELTTIPGLNDFFTQ